MATTKVHYKCDDEWLCFICAVKKAVVSDPNETKIILQCDPYEYTDCDECGAFIDDRIDI